MSIGVIIAASGVGKRFGRVYKPLLKIGSKTFIEIVVEKILQINNIKKIVIAANGEYIEKVKLKIGNCKLDNLNKKNVGQSVVVIKGGKERKFSVFRAFKELSIDKSIDIVIIHDAARPIIDLKVVSKMLKEIKKCDAIIPVKPVSETVKIIENGYVEKTIDRSKLYLSMTPQIFKKDILNYAYNKVDLNLQEVTDEAQLLEIAGKEIKIIKYEGYNVKVTYPQDHKLVKLIMNSK